MPPPSSHKVILLGDAGVGKTSLVEQYVNRTFTVDYRSATVGVDVREVAHRRRDGNRVVMELWDTSGQERFRSLSSSYYGGAHGALVVFDVNDPLSLPRALDWATEILSTMEVQISDDHRRAAEAELRQKKVPAFRAARERVIAPYVPSPDEIAEAAPVIVFVGNKIDVLDGSAAPASMARDSEGAAKEEADGKQQLAQAEDRARTAITEWCVASGVYAAQAEPDDDDEEERDGDENEAGSGDDGDSPGRTQKRRGCPIVFCSAKYGTNITDVFSTVAEQVFLKFVYRANMAARSAASESTVFSLLADDPTPNQATTQQQGKKSMCYLC